MGTRKQSKGSRTWLSTRYVAWGITASGFAWKVREKGTRGRLFASSCPQGLTSERSVTICHVSSTTTTNGWPTWGWKVSMVKVSSIGGRRVGWDGGRGGSKLLPRRRL